MIKIEKEDGRYFIFLGEGVLFKFDKNEIEKFEKLKEILSENIDEDISREMKGGDLK